MLFQDRLVSLENEKVEAGKIRDEKEALKKVAEEQESSALEVHNAKEEAIRALKAQEEKEQEQKAVNTIFTNFDSNGDDRFVTVALHFFFLIMAKFINWQYFFVYQKYI